MWGTPIDSAGYRKILNAFSQKIKHKLINRTTNFTSAEFTEVLHYSDEGREKLEDKLKSVVNKYLDKE